MKALYELHELGHVARIAILCVGMHCSPNSTVPARPPAGSSAPPPATAASTIPPGGAVDTFHGVTVADPFRWLEDGGSPHVRDWVDAEDKRARAVLNSLPERAAFASDLDRIRSRSEWIDIPQLRGKRYTYVRRDPPHERGVFYEYDPVKKSEIAIADLDRIDANEQLIATWWDVSRDGHHAVFRVSKNGNDAVEARVLDIRTRTWLPDRVRDIRYCYPVWDTEGRGFYYTQSPDQADMSPEKRAAQSRIRYHLLKSTADTDVVVKDKPDRDGVMEVPWISPDGRWLTASRWHGSTRNGLALFDRKAKKSTWKTFTPDRDAQYHIAFAKEKIYLWTNEDAPRGRIFAADPLRPERENWREIVRQRDDAIIADMFIQDKYLVIQYLEGAEKKYAVHRLDGSYVRDILPPAVGSISKILAEPGVEEGTALFENHAQPQTPYLIRAPAFSFERFPALQSSSSNGPYVTEKTYYTSPDGTRAPIFVVRAKTTPPNEPAPLMLYSYGAHGVSLTPGYRKGIESWLDRGGIYAEAIVRGGGEFGDEWHRAGMKQGRANVYADFIAASEYLIRQQWTTASQLVIRGKSFGGLLVAVAMTERPDLFAGVISEVPLTDMIRYRIGGNGPLWTDEFGVPENADEFATLFRFSPYHRVASGVSYPWLLVTGSADDDRVNPMHGRKFVAALHAAAPSATVLLRTEPNAAHGGPTTASAWARSEADIYAFARAAIAAHTHLTPAPPAPPATHSPSVRAPAPAQPPETPQ